MILLVPISPEVPKVHSSRIWPGLVIVIILCIGFLEIYETLQKDGDYVESIYSIAMDSTKEEPTLKPEAAQYLKVRPLLRISPAPADWNFERILYSNFIHGSILHLLLNLIGAFAGARLCSTFMPFLCTLSIFVLGGSIGIFMSILLSAGAGDYIPHVGASGGIFAMMGAYYVYNFRFRTRYFFWFPSRQGFINLRTSWFFFVDVILIELVLSAVQIFPSRMDNVDHFAHVFGFAAGSLLAFGLRLFQRWPRILQTRGEFIYWTKLDRPQEFHPIFTPFSKWIELLEINPYNDQLKLRLYTFLYTNCDSLSDVQLSQAFKFISPTFVRLHPQEVAVFIKEVLSKGRTLPGEWLAKIPYDSIIALAKFMATPADEQYLLFRLVIAYRKAQPGSGDVERKLELLLRKLKVLMPNAAARLESLEDSSDTASPKKAS